MSEDNTVTNMNITTDQLRRACRVLRIRPKDDPLKQLRRVDFNDYSRDKLAEMMDEFDLDIDDDKEGAIGEILYFFEIDLHREVRNIVRGLSRLVEGDFTTDRIEDYAQRLLDAVTSVEESLETEEETEEETKDASARENLN